MSLLPSSIYRQMSSRRSTLRQRNAGYERSPDSQSHRTCAALLAICLRFQTLNFAAPAFPPFKPPRRPSLTAAGPFGLGALDSSDSPVAMSTISLARWFGSRGRLGFAIDPSIRRAPRNSSVKLRHYLAKQLQPTARVGSVDRPPNERLRQKTRARRERSPSAAQGGVRLTVFVHTGLWRGAERVVVGSNGETYYTPNHYRSFVRIL